MRTKHGRGRNAQQSVPAVAVKGLQGVEGAALLAEALLLAVNHDHRRARVLLAAAVAPEVVLLLQQAALAALHLQIITNEQLQRCNGEFMQISRVRVAGQTQASCFARTLQLFLTESGLAAGA
jgi:hypothetical protein